MWLILKQAFKHSAENTSTIEPNESLLDFFSMKVKETFPNDDESSQRKVLLQMISTWGAFVGREVATQSLKFFWLEECIDGGEWVKEDTDDNCRLIFLSKKICSALVHILGYYNS